MRDFVFCTPGEIGSGSLLAHAFLLDDRYACLTLDVFDQIPLRQCILTTEFIYGFHIDLRIKSYYFPGRY
jgi:hypothetical protein